MAPNPEKGPIGPDDPPVIRPRAHFVTVLERRLPGISFVQVTTPAHARDSFRYTHRLSPAGR
jgi:hypothetical protein